MPPYNKTEYDRQYDEQNTIQFKMKLNHKTDKDIIDKLESVPNKQGYIKQLIRNDIDVTDQEHEEIKKLIKRLREQS